MRLPTGLSAAPRVAIYSQDGFGLGHMRRTSTIARQITQLSPDASILTLSDSPLGQFFPIFANHDYIKLPSIAKTAPGEWQATRLSIPFDQVRELRKEVIRSALIGFAPDIFLVDHMPHGAMGELIPALRALHSMTNRPQIVLGLRDILDDPEVIQRRWVMEGAYEMIEQFYTRVLIYGMRDVYDAAEKYQFPAHVVQKVRYCGYVCNLEPPADTSAVRARYLAGTPVGTQFIVAMAGGGADAFPMMQAVLEAVPEVVKERRCVVLMITGPFMTSQLAHDLQQLAHSLPVHLVESVDDTLSHIAAADLVISMAGYNTCAEILRMKKPAILIPRSGPSAEQVTRTRLFAARQWVDAEELPGISPGALAQKMLRSLHAPRDRKPPTRPDLVGGIVSANQLLALIPQKNHRSNRKVEIAHGRSYAYVRK